MDINEIRDKIEKQEVISVNELESLIRDWFLVADEGIIRLICATVIAHRLRGDPVWLFIISPPSGLKSELLMSLSDITGIHPLSSLTAHTLVSGLRSKGGEQNSLLDKLKNGILTVKDFTSILEINEAERSEILSQLREIYDGQYTKAFGNGVDFKWSGKIGFIAGVTEAIDMYQSMYSIMGERFMQYRMDQPDRKEATRKSMENSSNMPDIRKSMRSAFQSAIDSLEIPSEQPEIGSEWENEIIQLSDFATLARSGVRRNVRTREIEYVSAPEMPMRFAKQLVELARAFIIMGKHDDDRQILRKISLSSLPKNRRNVLLWLANNRKGIVLQEQLVNEEKVDEYGYINPKSEPNQEEDWTSRSIALTMGLPTTTARRLLEDINALGLADRGKNGKSDTWILKPEYQALMLEYFKENVDSIATSFPKI